MRRIDLLITQARRNAENTDYGTNHGISDDEILQYFNDAQRRLQTVILRDVPAYEGWDSTHTEDLVGGQSNDDISAGDACFGGMVRQVEYRYDSLEESYYTLDPIQNRYRSLQSVDNPQCYSIRGEQILISPIPASTRGNLRTTFVRAVDGLDKRRGKVSARTIAAGYYTDVTLANDSELDATNIALADTFCVVDGEGNVKYYNIPILSYNSGTRVLTPIVNSAPTTGGTISVNDHICLGQNVTTHPHWPLAVERYLLAYVAWKLLRRDSDDEEANADQELAALEKDIIAAYSMQVLDPMRVPVIDGEWFD